MYVLLLIMMILSMIAQGKVSSTFAKYSKIQNRRGLTGAEVAMQMLRNAGIGDVTVERVGGKLTDHYDPSKKRLRLSEEVYGSRSVAALGVAAHECGHAIQHDQKYSPLGLRSVMVPVANFGSKLSFPLIFLGFLFTSATGDLLLLAGILLFSFSVLFTLITLPVEFDASHRAIDALVGQDFLGQDEIGGAKKVLSAAAMTYVAAAAVAVVQLLRLLLIFANRRD
ncbi:MAG: zinc metallopeptidase [Bacillota bacterium]